MSEYGPILDSNNPLSLNSDDADQGIIMHVLRSNNFSPLCHLFYINVINLLLGCKTCDDIVLSLLYD